MFFELFCSNSVFRRLHCCLLICFTIILFFPFTSVCCSDNYRSSHLLVKKVKLDVNNVDRGNYVEGKDLFSDYSYYGLPEIFFIKKIPDLNFSAKDIERIEIIKQPITIPDFLAFNIKVVFSNTALKKLKEFTKKNFGEHIAIEIDGEIFVIAKIINVIDGPINISMANKDIDYIKNRLSNLSSVEIIENGKKVKP